MSEIAAEGTQPVSAEIREGLLEPFIAATRVALGEMASTEVVVRAISQSPRQPAPGEVSVMLKLASATLGCLTLSFPQPMAAIVARRVLAGVSVEVDEQLIHDCIAEVGNVVAGQAKALLADTPNHFSFSLPRVVVGVNEAEPGGTLDCLVVVFTGDLGEFALRLYLKR